MLDRKKRDFLANAAVLAMASPLYRNLPLGSMYTRFLDAYDNGSYRLSLQEYSGPDGDTLNLPEVLVTWILVSDRTVELMQTEQWDYFGQEYEAGENLFFLDALALEPRYVDALRDMLRITVAEIRPKRVVYYRRNGEGIRLYSIPIPEAASLDDIKAFPIDIGDTV